MVSVWRCMSGRISNQTSAHRDDASDGLGDELSKLAGPRASFFSKSSKEQSKQSLR